MTAQLQKNNTTELDSRQAVLPDLIECESPTSSLPGPSTENNTQPIFNSPTSPKRASLTTATLSGPAYEVLIPATLKNSATVTTTDISATDCDLNTETIHKLMENGIDFTRKVSTRKRIYGEDYRALNNFCIKPHFKMTRLERLNYETIENNLQNRGSMTTSISDIGLAESASKQQKRDVIQYCSSDPTPTAETRIYDTYTLCIDHISQLCWICYSPICVCLK
ncbi:OrNVorf122-like [Venturia canescens]|uniref:OrNVorf122-like n=1 Tax=Venturia canescens TaxID=32260 RepID=A0ACB9ZKT0_9HYME|nr:uncharacterized LOC122408865 [Venturia canescens]KAI5630632.1 OrNVorf122-like [Venturia canescens]